MHRMRLRSIGATAAVTTLAFLASCGASTKSNASDRADASVAAAAASEVLSATPEARARVAFLRERIADRPTPAARFALAVGAFVHAVIPGEVLRGTPRAASVYLPLRATGPIRLKDDESSLSVQFSLRDASDASISVADGYAVYEGALAGADVVHRVIAEGTEDYAVFTSKPAREELAYDIDVSNVAGLRLVSNTLEFLDGGGVPRLRVAPPYVLDAKGARHAARLDVTGCAYDVSPQAPWGRPVTAPGASSCALRVAWSGVPYPIAVDPAWTTTGAMSAARGVRTASVLATGKVLVAGGDASGKSAELYDPATGTFAATGSLIDPRTSTAHTASFLSSGKVLVAGGDYSNGVAPVQYLANAELYDPASGIFTATGPMSTARYAHTATVLASGKVLIVGGSSDGTGDATAELYDPGSSTFTPTGSMTVGRNSHMASILTSGKVLVVGGLTGVLPGVRGTLDASAELYDPVNGAFTMTGSMNGGGMYGQTATLLASGNVLIAGGHQNFSPANPIVASAEFYDPTSGTFKPGGAMLEGRSGHTATLLASGLVLFAGGVGFRGYGRTAVLVTSELFDPASGTSVSTGPMKTTRSGHAAALLPLGNVLIVGGDESAELLFAPRGGGCATGDDCVSGVCEDGICCAGACSGTCMTCSKGAGACVTVTGADDPNTCTAANTCDAAGACKLKNGEPCPGGGAACQSGLCVDGLCCNAACGGGCDSCNQPGHLGMCSLALARDPGGAPSCAPYVCNGTSASCPSSCSHDSDCATGNVCNAKASICQSAGTCDGDHTTVGATGTVQDCSPYKCNANGGCKPSCQSVDDCVAPNACDPSGQCVPAPSSSGSGGCHSSPTSTPDVWQFALCGVLAALARRRARAQAPRVLPLPQPRTPRRQRPVRPS
jgi:hypothetical protein